MAFHDRLKQARKNAGMTQEGVAKLLGVAKSTYSGYETGKKRTLYERNCKYDALLCSLCRLALAG